MSWWLWLLWGVVMTVASLTFLAVLFVLCGPPAGRYRTDDQEQAQRRARRGGTR